VALPDGICKVDEIEGPSPLIVRPPAGAHVVECRREEGGVVLRRKVTKTTSPGKPVKVLIDLRIGP
jgi:hypothetical protein